MKRLGRMQEYRKCRHRSAVGRRGCLGKGPGRYGWGNGKSPSGWHWGRTDTVQNFQFLLRQLVRKVCAYPGVAGILYRHSEAAAEVQIVAPRPMTGPMRVLAAAWTDELQDQCPTLLWSVAASSAPPHDHETYHCLYWRQQ